MEEKPIKLISNLGKVLILADDYVSGLRISFSSQDPLPVEELFF